MANDQQNKLPELDQLDDKINSIKKGMAGPGNSSTAKKLPPTLAGLAMRAGVELVAGVAVGAGVGYGLDRWLDSGPWLFILGFLVGAVAGMLNVYRAINGVGMALGYKSKESKK